MLLLELSLLGAAPRKPVSNIFQRTKDGRILHKPGTTVPVLESADGTPRTPVHHAHCIGVALVFSKVSLRRRVRGSGVALRRAFVVGLGPRNGFASEIGQQVLLG